MRALIDADILRYEIGYAAEAGWRHVTEDPDALPPFDYVENVLNQRLEYILGEVEADSYTLYITEGKTFREDIATVKPYKGTRPSNKPWHYANLTVWMTDILGANVITGIEADDALAIEHTKGEDTVLVSRDKDLLQVPGLFYSWELGKQPAFGPEEIDIVGSLKLSDDNKKLTGTGYAFFCAQVLMGDTVDNIPGLPGCGPKGAYVLLEPYTYAVQLNHTLEQYCLGLYSMVEIAYQDHYGHEWEERMLEQGRLCWMTRRLHEDGSPVLWEIGMWE